MPEPHAANTVFHKMLHACLLVLLGCAIRPCSAQEYAPGFYLHADGSLQWQILSGQISEFTFPEYEHRLPLCAVDSVYKDAMSEFSRYSALGGQSISGNPLLKFPGFDSPTGVVWLIDPPMPNSAAQQEAHWDTLYFSEEFYTYNGGYAIVPHESMVHYRTNGELDSVYHARCYENLCTPIESYGIYYTPQARIDSITTYFMMETGGDAIRSFPTSCFHFQYTSGDALRRCVVYASPHNAHMEPDSIIQGMRLVLQSHSLDIWNDFNRRIQYSGTFPRVHQWIETFYTGNHITEMLVYSDQVSSISRYTWTYEGERVKKFHLENSFGLQFEYTFTYEDDGRLASINSTSYYRLGKEENSGVYEDFYRMVYNAHNELIGYLER
jgi:hypothetical protein